VSEGISSKGCILVGPYEISKKTSQAFSSNSIIINATEELDASTPSIKQFNIRDNYVQKIHWKNISTVPLLNDEKIIHIAKHFDEVDFSSYKTLNMHFKFSLASKETPDATAEDAFVFLLDRNAISTESDGQCALKFSISHDSWKTISENTWHKISINLSTGNVYINDTFISKAEINNSIIPTRLKIKLDTAKDNFLYKEGRFYFDELYLEGMSLNGKFENITRGQYKKDGTIFKTKNDFPILKNVLIETTMKESVDFSKEKKSSFNFLNTSFLSAEVASVLLSFDGVFSNKQKNAIVNAGYTIASTTPLFSVVSFQDEYRYDATSASEYADFFSLDFSNLRVPLALSFNAKSAKTLVSQNQKVSTKLESVFEKEDWNIRFYLSHDANQKKKNFTTDEPDENNESNFASSWLTSIKNAYSIGEKNAIERKQVSEFYLSSVTPFSKFHPEFIFKTFAEYINNSETKFSDKLSFKYSLPFSIKNHSFNFWSEKTTTGSNLTTIHGNYFSDYESMFKTWKNRSFFFYSFPIYDLVSTHLCKKIGQDVASSNELDFLNFSTSYNFSWQRNLFSSLADFFMPCSATFSLERDIRQSKTTSDIYQLKTTVITNAFNIFGSTSALKKAKWFEFDEYSTSITGAIKIPKDYPKDITWYLSFYSQQGFFINDFDKLESAIEFSIETNSDWSFRTSATWKRMGKHSPLVFLTSRIYKKYDKENAKIKRSHSFDIHLYSKEKELAQIYTLANSSDIQLFSHLAFTSSQSIFFESIQNTVMRLALNLSFSVKLTF
ncbi:MAG: hypothetical protein IKI31_03115, partial [Treponema sp.]|nr:hypothetical protein [Treponema sp.]